MIPPAPGLPARSNSLSIAPAPGLTALFTLSLTAAVGAQSFTHEISFRIGNERTYLSVANGFAEVLRDGVQVLAEVCEPAEEIDVERARRAKERAEKRLATHDDDIEFARARSSLARASARIQIRSRLG